MSSINATLCGAASALDALQFALNVTQNNIDNASTAGYAKQVVDLEADPFDPALGLSGGVSNGPLIDTRDLLAEKDVWQQSASQGDSSAQSTALTAVQNAMPVSKDGSLTSALTTFFNDASAWSAAPDSVSAQQSVMVAASSLAQSFHSTAASVAAASSSIDAGIATSVGQINQISTRLADLNGKIQNGGEHDQGLQAQLYSSLESLSSLVNIRVLQQSDGGVNVTLSSGAALVIGSQPYQLSSSNAASAANSIDPQAPPDTQIQAADGSVVNGEITSGTLAGLLQVRNVTIPNLIGDASQPGALNQLAASLATAVNDIVSQGCARAGAQPSGLALFTAPDPTHPTTAAVSLAVNPNITAAQLPAADQNGVANGVPLALAALANSAVSDLGSAGYMSFYGNAAASVGLQLNQAQSNQTLTAQTLAQAQSMRQSSSGVSLNAEATNVLQLQESYQAVAKMVSTIETLAQSLIAMMPNS